MRAMECLLRLWDEFDDVVAASRMLVSRTFDELAEAGTSAATLLAAVLPWLQR